MSDLISGREMLNRYQVDLCYGIACKDCSMCTEDGGCRVEEWIDKFPSADRPQGKWIDEADKYDASFGIHDYRCSNCNSYADEYIGGHEWYTAGKPNFCPHCGARMKGADDE